MSSKKRKQTDEYVQYVQCIHDMYDGWESASNLSNSSLTQAKVKEDFLKLHGDGEDKNTTPAEFKVNGA